jgi:hypothetical protein
MKDAERVLVNWKKNNSLSSMGGTMQIRNGNTDFLLVRWQMFALANWKVGFTTQEMSIKAAMLYTLHDFVCL